MTRTPVQALADQLREADRQVIALGTLGWHSKPDGSPEREMFRTKLELAGRISQQLRSLGMAPPPVETGLTVRLEWAEAAAKMFQPTKRCQAAIRGGQHCGMAVSDGDYCRFHGGQRESRVFVGEREVRLHEERARIVTEAVNTVLAELHPVRWQSKRLRRRVAAALRRLTVNPKHAS